MSLALFIAFVGGWLALFVLFARRFFLALKSKRWGFVMLHGIALSILASCVDWMVYAFYALQNPGLF